MQRAMTKLTASDMSVKLLILYCILLLAFLPTSISDLRLRQASVISRHGARSPTKPFPNDPYKDVWPQGYGQLTKVGIQQMFRLGQYLRSYYKGYINSTYINDEIMTRSSNFERALMSGEAALAGLYPPAGFQVWNKDLLWQPVPVHTVGQQDDILLDMDNPVCPRYDQLYRATMESESFKEENALYMEYYEYLWNKTGKTENMNPNGAWDVYDDLLSRITNGIPIPSWVTEKDLSILADLFVPWEMDNKFGGFEKGRLKGGPLMTALISSMNQSRNGTLDPPSRKLFLYSGHDNNIVTTMKLTKTYNERYVPYASSLHVELYEDASDYYVMMKLQNDTNLEPFLINITVCGNKVLCPLDEFIGLMEPYLITHDQWLEECALPTSNTLSLEAIIGICVAVAAVLLLGTVIYLCRVGLRPKPVSSVQISFNNDRGRAVGEKSPLFSPN